MFLRLSLGSSDLPPGAWERHRPIRMNARAAEKRRRQRLVRAVPTQESAPAQGNSDAAALAAARAQRAAAARAVAPFGAPLEPAVRDPQADHDLAARGRDRAENGELDPPRAHARARAESGASATSAAPTVMPARSHRPTSRSRLARRPAWPHRRGSSPRPTFRPTTPRDRTAGRAAGAKTLMRRVSGRRVRQTSSRRDEAVALAANGFDTARFVRAAVDLPPKLRDVHLAGPPAADVRAVPEHAHDRLARDRPPGLCREQDHQPELGGRQVHLLAADEEPSAVEVDADVAEDAHVRHRPEGRVTHLARNALDRDEDARVVVDGRV